MKISPTHIPVDDATRQLIRRLGAGETLLPLAGGVYLVRIGDRAYKVLVN